VTGLADELLEVNYRFSAFADAQHSPIYSLFLAEKQSPDVPQIRGDSGG